MGVFLSFDCCNWMVAGCIPDDDPRSLFRHTDDTCLWITCEESNCLLDWTQQDWLFPLCDVIFYRLLMCSCIVLFLTFCVPQTGDLKCSQCVFMPFLIVSSRAPRACSIFHTFKRFHIYKHLRSSPPRFLLNLENHGLCMRATCVSHSGWETKGLRSCVQFLQK